MKVDVCDRKIAKFVVFSRFSACGKSLIIGLAILCTVLVVVMMMLMLALVVVVVDDKVVRTLVPHELPDGLDTVFGLHGHGQHVVISENLHFAGLVVLLVHLCLLFKDHFVAVVLEAQCGDYKPAETSA